MSDSVCLFSCLFVVCLSVLHQVVAPKKEKLAVAQQSLNETMAVLNDKRRELKEVPTPA